MDHIKLLFICSRNKWRSLTAEKIFQNLNGYQVRSVGTENTARVKVSNGDIGWADLIFVMERKHARRLHENFSSALRGKEVICLDIPDAYEFMNEDLIELLKSRVAEYIELP